MPNSQDKNFVNRKRQILVADDEIINREILGVILSGEYEVLFAEDGAKALEAIREYRDTLSLVLLDIMMPVMTGLEVLEAVKAEPELSRIPIIVVTAERDTELESLKLGAIDFVPKPYPDPAVILARVQRIIELSEDRNTIQSTERDGLTGLLNRDYFYLYAEQYDQHHTDTEMDAIVVDVNHFHMINERYGKEYADGILCRIGEHVREMVHDSGGIVCRRQADTFMIYCPHRNDYREIMENASVQLTDDSTENRVRLRMGVYSNVDKTIDIERRFDRAKIAADTVKGNITKNIGIYDSNLHERQIYTEQLIEDFPAAITEKQFKVFYQPKFDVRPNTPILTSAEALVRWEHPKLGMISPGVFIPLFEENGLIEKLDTYVWNETSRQIRLWKDNFGYSIPISVNVSRIDLYNPELSNVLLAILNRHQLSSQDLLLEVTESAYTQDSVQIINTVEHLRSLGFKIEMDDFGTGYSSLNMISTLPIDVLKLDMHFIRNAFKDGGSTHMLEVIIGIADYLAVPVVAEGVETEEQLNALKALGCDIVQGYFFSKPVPAVEFEPFILQRKEVEKGNVFPENLDAETKVKAAQLDAIRENSAAEPTQKAAEEEREEVYESRPGFQLRTASIFFVILALLASAALIVADLSVTRGYQNMKAASDRYISAQLAASDMESGSDFLTDRVRCFVVTGELDYLEDFFEELQVTRRRDRAVQDLEVLLAGNDSSALANLNTALELSNELVETENLAMRLTLEAREYHLSNLPEEISSIQLSAEDLALSPEELRDKAQDLVFNNNYIHYKDRIRENVNLCTQALIRSSSQELERSSSQLQLLVNIQTVMTIVFLMIVLAIVAVISSQVRRPLTKMVELMQEQKSIPPTGIEELRFVTRTYNKILEENQVTREKLSHEASHDALTGLFNRGAYDLLMESVDTEHMALILLDIDNFKQINDTYGHAVGDRVLKRVAEILRHSFRSVDIMCRIGGDEFAVVMTRANSSMKQLVANKIMRANDLLKHPKDDLPPVSLSVGVAFSDRENPQGDIFKDADAALYQVKKTGRDGCAFY